MPYNPKDSAKYRAKKEAESKNAKGGAGGGAAGAAARKATATMPHCALCGPHKQMISALHMKEHYDTKHPREPFDLEAMSAVFAKVKEDMAAAKSKERGCLRQGAVKGRKQSGERSRDARKGFGNKDSLPVELLAAMAGIIPLDATSRGKGGAKKRSTKSGEAVSAVAEPAPDAAPTEPAGVERVEAEHDDEWVVVDDTSAAAADAALDIAATAPVLIAANDSADDGDDDGAEGAEGAEEDEEDEEDAAVMLAQLQEMLADGEIEKEEYDEMAADYIQELSSAAMEQGVGTDEGEEVKGVAADPAHAAEEEEEEEEEEKQEMVTVAAAAAAAAAAVTADAAVTAAGAAAAAAAAGATADAAAAVSAAEAAAAAPGTPAAAPIANARTTAPPRCPAGHKMIISEPTGVGAITWHPYICDRCHGRSNAGHLGGTMRRWSCAVCEADLCFACEPEPEANIASKKKKKKKKGKK